MDRYRVFTAAVDKRVGVDVGAAAGQQPAGAGVARGRDGAAACRRASGCAGGVPVVRGGSGARGGGPRHHRLTGELVHRYLTVWGIPPVCPYAYDAFEPACASCMRSGR